MTCTPSACVQKKHVRLGWGAKNSLNIWGNPLRQKMQMCLCVFIRYIYIYIQQKTRVMPMFISTQTVRLIYKSHCMYIYVWVEININMTVLVFSVFVGTFTALELHEPNLMNTFSMIWDDHKSISRSKNIWPSASLDTFKLCKKCGQ